MTDHARRCFAAWGEDLVLAYVFQSTEMGRYLDVGCYHPDVSSNTRLLHDRGWTGVNIDPNPFMIEACRLARPGDVNLRLAIAGDRGKRPYFVFHEWASSNTLCEAFAKHISATQQVDITSRSEVEVVPLVEIMQRYFRDRAPDFLNIDVEDLDSEVLCSNDWNRFRPSVVAVEDFEFRVDAPLRSKIYALLTGHGYKLFSRTVYTNFFIETAFNDATHRFA